MLDKIKHLLKHSFVYSISNAAIKAAGILLLPLYTTFFTVDEYGRLGLLITTIIIISQTLVLGQGQSIIRFNNLAEYKKDNKSIFFTLTIFVAAIVAAFLVISNLSLNFITGFLDRQYLFNYYLKICSYIIAFITFNNLFLGKLRADDDSVFYTIAGLLKLVVMVGLAFYFIAYMHSGIEGVLYAQLAGEASTTIFVLPKMIKSMSPKLRTAVIPESIRFGFPLIFWAFSMNLLNVSDRYIIKYFMNDAALGLYELGYRVSGIMYMFIIMPFSLTLLPSAYKVYGKEGDKRYYLKLKTYITFALVWIGLALSVFGKEIIVLFAQSPDYYPAFKIVPIIVFSYVFYGMTNVSTLGMYLTGNMKYVAVVTIISAAINIWLNFWLIPQIGIFGAAINTLIAFIILDILSTIASNKYFKIPYENLKIIKIILAGIVLFIPVLFIKDLNLIFSFGVKLLLVLVFPFLLYLLKFYEPIELMTIKGAVKKWKDPKSWTVNIQKEIFNFKDKPDDNK